MLFTHNVLKIKNIIYVEIYLRLHRIKQLKHSLSKHLLQFMPCEHEKKNRKLEYGGVKT